MTWYKGSRREIVMLSAWFRRNVACIQFGTMPSPHSQTLAIRFELISAFHSCLSCSEREKWGSNQPRLGLGNCND